MYNFLFKFPLLHNISENNHANHTVDCNPNCTVKRVFDCPLFSNYPLVDLQLSAITIY